MKKKVSLQTYADERKIPIEYLTKNGFRQGNSCIEIQTSGPNGEAGRVQFRHYDVTASRPATHAFTWAPDDNRICYPSNLHILPTLTANDCVFLVEGASDAVTASFAGLHAIGFPGANFVDANIVIELAKKKCKLVIVQEPGAAGRKFAREIVNALDKANHRKPVSLLEMPDSAKDLSGLFMMSSDSENFHLRLSRLVSTAEPVPFPGRRFIEFDGNAIIVDLRDKAIVSERQLKDGTKRTSKIANFYCRVVSQRSVVKSGRTERRLRVRAEGMFGDVSWKKDFEVDARIFSSANQFMTAIQIEVGSKASIFSQIAPAIIKTLASELGTDLEDELLPTGGYHNGRHILGNCEITFDKISFFPSPLTRAADFERTSGLGFMEMDRTTAFNTLAQFFDLSSRCYRAESWCWQVGVVALNTLLLQRPKFSADTRGGIEIVGEFGEGKTQLSLSALAFYSSILEERMFWMAKDSIASIEAAAAYSNGAPLFINDIKILRNPTILAERLQNIVDGAVYTRFVENDPQSTNPFVGLVIANGQEALTSYSTSYASRMMTTHVRRGFSRRSFKKLQASRKNLSGVSPYIIQALLDPREMSILEDYYNKELLLLHARASASSSVDRTVAYGALVVACIRYTINLLSRNSNYLSSNRLYRIGNLAAASMRKIVLKQIRYVEKMDVVNLIFTKLIQGLESGALFLGDVRPSHCASTAVNVGKYPNREQGTIWINYGSLQNYLKR